MEPSLLQMMTEAIAMLPPQGPVTFTMSRRTFNWLTGLRARFRRRKRRARYTRNRGRIRPRLRRLR
jgi:hypothetical protein